MYVVDEDEGDKVSGGFRTCKKEKNGVEMRYYKKHHFLALSQPQNNELNKWRKMRESGNNNALNNREKQTK